jgi:hypothetical protein
VRDETAAGLFDHQPLGRQGPRRLNQLAQLALCLRPGEPVRRPRPAFRAERALHEPAVDAELAVPGRASARGRPRKQRSRAVGAAAAHAPRVDDDDERGLDEKPLDMHLERLLTPGVRPALDQPRVNRRRRKMMRY